MIVKFIYKMIVLCNKVLCKSQPLKVAWKMFTAFGCSRPGVSKALNFKERSDLCEVFTD